MTNEDKKLEVEVREKLFDKIVNTTQSAELTEAIIYEVVDLIQTRESGLVKVWQEAVDKVCGTLDYGMERLDIERKENNELQTQLSEDRRLIKTLQKEYSEALELGEESRGDNIKLQQELSEARGEVERLKKEVETISKWKILIDSGFITNVMNYSCGRYMISIHKSLQSMNAVVKEKDFYKCLSIAIKRINRQAKKS